MFQISNNTIDMMVPQNKKHIAEKPLTSVMEDYLEAIFDLDKEKRVVRVKDIAKRMDVKMPTVSSMLKSLNNKGLVYYEKYEYVELTKDGAEVGKEMRRRHKILLKFLTKILKIEFIIADEEACKMEHTLAPPPWTALPTLWSLSRHAHEPGRAGFTILKNIGDTAAVLRNVRRAVKPFLVNSRTRLIPSKTVPLLMAVNDMAIGASFGRGGPIF